MPDDSGVTVVTTLVWFYFFPREAAGASRARHSLRPLMFRWLHVRANLRKIMRRDRGGVGGLPVVVDCQSSSLRALAKQSILARIRKLDCFVVSLLAMTAWKTRCVSNHETAATVELFPIADTGMTMSVQISLKRRKHRIADIGSAVAAAEFHRLDPFGVGLVDGAFDALA